MSYTTAAILDGGVVIRMETPGANSTRPNVKNDLETGVISGTPADWALWGANDDYPTWLRHKIENTTIARATLHRVAEMIYGKGLATYRNVYINGELHREFFHHPEFEAFRDENNLDKRLFMQLVSYCYQHNNFWELIYNRAGTKIARLNDLDTEYCRLPNYNQSSERLDFLRFNAQFTRERGPYNSDNTVKIPLYDDKSVDFLAQVKGKKFAMHTKNGSPGRNTYALPVHAALFDADSWADVSIQVPRAIARMTKNQHNLRYQVKIPDNYWTRHYPAIPNSDDQGWTTYSHERRRELMEQKFAEFENYIRKDETLGFFYSHYEVDQYGEAKNEGWKIEALPTPEKASEWVPTSDAANAEIVRTIGYDTSIGIGGTGGGIGAGSGSDKRTGAENTYAQLQPIELMFLEPLRLIARINGWTDLKFTFIRGMAESLDANPTGNSTKS